MRRRTAIATMAASATVILGYRTWQFDRPSNPDTLVVATTWPRPICDRLVDQIWSNAQPQERMLWPDPPIEWLTISANEDLVRLIKRRPRIDFVFGGPLDAYQRLERNGVLQPWNEQSPIPVHSLMVRQLGLATGKPLDPTRIWETWDQPQSVGKAVLSDPRTSPLTSSFVNGYLSLNHWNTRWSSLVRVFANARTILWHRGNGPGTSIGASTHPRDPSFGIATDFEQHPSLLDSQLQFVPLLDDKDRPLRWIEGLARTGRVTRNGLVEATQDLLMQRFAIQAQIDPESSTMLDVNVLIDDLVGATLVDANEELRRTWRRLIAVGRPQDWESWMTGPPPWPPASVLRYRRDSVNGEPNRTLETNLLRLIAPDPSLRHDLERSWQREARPIGRAILNELVQMGGGQMMREPRLRNWLRAEWTAWARQRYRRIAERCGREPAPPNWLMRVSGREDE